MNIRKVGTSVPSLEISKVPKGTGFLLECGRTVSAESASHDISDWKSSVVGLEEIRLLAQGRTDQEVLTPFQQFILSFSSTAESRQLGENPTYLLRTAIVDNAKISFDMHNVGDILELEARSSMGMLVRQGGFLAAQVGVVLDRHIINDKTLSNVMGHTRYMQRISGHGRYWLEIQGDFSKPIKLWPGEKLIVDPLKLIALTENINMKLISTSSDKVVRNAEGRDYGLLLQANALDGTVYLSSLPQKDHKEKK